MGPTEPVPWGPLADLGVHTCRQCESLFEERRADLDPDLGSRDGRGAALRVVA